MVDLLPRPVHQQAADETCRRDRPKPNDLFPEALDDYVSQENPVRFSHACIAALDLEQMGFTDAVPHESGRPPCNPADLHRLYIYGYLNHLRSNRQLQREANRNVQLMWLLRRLALGFPVPGPSAIQSPTSESTTLMRGCNCRSCLPCQPCNGNHEKTTMGCIEAFPSGSSPARFPHIPEGRTRGSGSLVSIAWLQRTANGACLPSATRAEIHTRSPAEGGKASN